jgi:hypothetical protein
MLFFYVDGLESCLGTVATMGLWFVLQVMYEYREPWWNDIDRGKPKNSEKTCHSDTLFNIYHTLTESGANPGLRGERPATNRLRNSIEFRLLFGL